MYIPKIVSCTYRIFLYCLDTGEVQAAKREFLKEFERAVNGLLVELAPSPVKAQVSKRDSHTIFLVFLVITCKYLFVQYCNN